MIVAAAECRAVRQPFQEEVEAYLHLSKEEIVRLVLCLLVEEALQGRLAIFRSSVREDEVA